MNPKLKRLWYTFDESILIVSSIAGLGLVSYGLLQTRLFHWWLLPPNSMPLVCAMLVLIAGLVLFLALLAFYAYSLRSRWIAANDRIAVEQREAERKRRDAEHDRIREETRARVDAYQHTEEDEED